ncbi:unnamed protein product [Mytilus edulis]|uniref:Integrase catalytic domain-containing protein n=1 Tax=Mytilus edulis TaxID=6550 RepID=A0A8S3VKW4_MYTED|nr:unnamed protein product [Mytilus edulis]
MSSLNYEDYLDKIWHDPKHAAAFTGSDKLYNIVKQEGKIKIGRHKIKQWLQNQDAYSLSRNNVHKFKRSRYVVDTIDSLWEMDLAQLDKFQDFNSGNKFLLFVIDCFSKFLWIQPIVDKTHTSVLNALKTIMSGNRKPSSVRSDLGKEFKNQYVRKYLSNQGINTYYSLNDTKCAIVERSIRSLKSILFRYFRHNQTYKYVNVLQDMVKGYNARPHRTLGGFAPFEVNKHNAGEVRLSAYLARNPKRREKKVVKKTKIKSRKKSFRYKVNDLVRLTFKRHPFQRGYLQKWTEEIFKISRRYFRQQLSLYKVVDLQDEAIEGTFQDSEVQKVRKDGETKWKIEKVIKRRKRNGTKQVLVRWLGYPKKFDSWVPVSDIQNE